VIYRASHRTIADTNPDVTVIDLKNPNRDVLENMFHLSRAVKRPIAMFVDRSDRAAGHRVPLAPKDAWLASARQL
jgi:AmiR/NasT family two-component response regulator